MATGDNSPKGDNPAFIDVKTFVERSGLRPGTVENLIKTGRLIAYSESGVRYLAAAALAQLGDILSRVPVRQKALGQDP